MIGGQAETMSLRIMSLLCGLLASLLPATATAQMPERGGTLTFAVTAEAPSTDCYAITNHAAVHVRTPLGVFVIDQWRHIGVMAEHTQLHARQQTCNLTRSATPEFDVLYDKFKSASEEAQRKSVAAVMQRMVIEQANSVPVPWSSRLLAHVSTLKG